MAVPDSTAPADAVRLVPAGTWQLDSGTSSLRFRVRKFLWHPKGRFEKLEGTIESGGGEARLSGRASVDSLRTGIPLRDWHLRTHHFFDAKRYPTIDFEASAIEAPGGGIRLTGELAIKGATRPFQLDGSLEASADRLRLRAEGRIDRHEFGVVGPAFVEMGGLMIGREVELTLDAGFGRV